ncbi:MAG: DUF1801 domain-containing protein [Planctomycetota bacterium]
MQSKAKTVAEYLSSLSSDQREVLAAVRTVILANLDSGFQECMQYGMVGYSVPHSRYPAGYHCDPKQPLPFAALAAQKNAISLHLMGLYMNPTELQWFTKAWKEAGKKLDMGKACVRFKKLDDVALDVVGQAFRRISADAWIATYETALAGNAQRKAAKKAVAKQPKRAPKAETGKIAAARKAAAKPVAKAKKKAAKASKKAKAR